MQANNIIQKIQRCKDITWSAFALIVIAAIFAIYKEAEDGYVIIFVMLSAIVLYIFLLDLEKDVISLVKRYEKAKEPFLKENANEADKDNKVDELDQDNFLQDSSTNIEQNDLNSTLNEENNNEDIQIQITLELDKDRHLGDKNER